MYAESQYIAHFRLTIRNYENRLRKSSRWMILVFSFAPRRGQNRQARFFSRCRPNPILESPTADFVTLAIQPRYGLMSFQFGIALKVRGEGVGGGGFPSDSCALFLDLR
jgi:hypothetical protein